ncbi:MAG TPA: M20/M25/M40 family metallo-hydrolase, partial [Terriglobales bacterium]|nr:M20/M25/M40 family metallo-hydrolase [Terriglobales bacterium]
ALTRGGAMTFLETLTDTIGGRVTGSAESEATAELILKTLKDAGFENAHIEEYPLPARWRRGPATGSVVSPVKRPIMIQSYGWAPGTDGRKQVPLLSIQVAADGTASVDPARLRGAAVLVDLAVDAGTSISANYVVRRSAIARELARVGAVAMMIQSDKPGRMLYTSAAGIYQRAPLPLLSVAKEDALFLRRLLLKGDVRLELDVQNFLDITPGKERNVIADLPGSNPEEVVLVGAHFDSWDTAPGANDDGSGVAAVLEAARILKSLGVKTKATIRFAFFSGEEQACLGSRAYVKAHADALDHHRAALTMDGGAQMPLGFSLAGRKDLEEPTKRLLGNLRSLGANGVSQGDLSNDDETFVVAGIPTLNLWVVEGDYDINHHAITDTVDKIDPRALALDTAVLAAVAYEAANSDQRMGRRLSNAEVHDLVKSTGELEYVELDYKGQEWAEPTRQ